MTNVVQVPAMTLYGLERIGPSSFNESEGAGASFGDAMWQEFIAAISALDAPMTGEMYGVSWPADDQTPPQYVHYFCGFEFPVHFDGSSQLDVEGGPYFSYFYQGPPADIDQGFHKAYLQALPESGLTPRNGQHLEVYGEEYDPNSPIARFRILIPVQP